MDRGQAAIHSHRMRTISFTETHTSITVRAPQLLPLVELWFAVREDPSDRRSKIQLALLEKEGLSDCPRCGSHLSPAQYRRTRTSYSDRASLCCAGCATEFVVDERTVV